MVIQFSPMAASILTQLTPMLKIAKNSTFAEMEFNPNWDLVHLGLFMGKLLQNVKIRNSFLDVRSGLMRHKTYHKLIQLIVHL